MKIIALFLLLITCFNLSLQASAHTCEFLETTESQEVLEECESEATIDGAVSDSLIESPQSIQIVIKQEHSHLLIAAFEVATPPPEYL